MKPVLHPQTFLEKKIQRKHWDVSDAKSKFVCLMKYFPKYYKNIELLDKNPLSRPVQSRIKQLKIIKKSYCSMISDSDEKTLKRLFRGCRKTLKSVPSFGWQSLRLSQYFPRVETIEIWWYRFYGISEKDEEMNTWSRRILEEDCEDRELTSRMLWKGIKRSYGYFWSGNRFVENVKILCRSYFSLMIIKKLNDSKRFLASLKTLELMIDYECEEENNILTLLVKNTNFLQHVTSLKINTFSKNLQLLQPLINCCLQCSSLSLQGVYGAIQSLNLNYHQNLQALAIKFEDFWTLMDRNEIPSSLREVSLLTVITEDMKYDNLGNFFEKWKRYNNLKVLNLKFQDYSKINLLMETFILPLLKEKVQLETFNCHFGFLHVDSDQRLFDLDVFFEGIKSLRSLKNLSLTCWKPNYPSNPRISFIYGGQQSLLLPNFSSLHLCAESSPKFNVSKFFRGIFHNMESRPKIEETSVVRLSKIRLRSPQELVKLVNLLNQASEFKTLQIFLEIEFYIESIDEISPTFRLPLSIPNNTQLMVQFFLARSAWRNSTYDLRIPYEFREIQSFFKFNEGI